jgi:MFS-type transporter involved in bile tolerance (Atg22 family)
VQAGVAHQLTSSYRRALAPLVVLLVVGFILLARVPLQAGIEQAGNVVPARF